MILIAAGVIPQELGLILGAMSPVIGFLLMMVADFHPVIYSLFNSDQTVER